MGCGCQWFPYEYLRTAIFAYGFDSSIRNTKLASDIHLGPDLITEISKLSMNKTRASRGKKETWNGVLMDTSRREATDPRDKVFAVLGLADDDPQQIISPNYRKSTSVVYQEAMALALKTTRLDGDLDLLSFVTYRRDLELPSWCIDFSISDWRNNRKMDDIGQVTYPYSCGGLGYSDLDLDLQAGSISLTGFCIGSPSFIPMTASGTQYQDMKPQRELPHEEFMKANPNIMEYFASGMDFVTRGVEAALKFRLSENEVLKMMADGVVWETYFAGKAPRSIADLHYGADGSAEQPRSVWAVIEAYAAKHYWPADDLPWKSSLAELPGEMEDKIREISAAFPFQDGGTTFFTTDTGYAGRSRDPLEKGDLVCIIYGSQYPVVLRPRGDAFELITFAWVHGAMEGQCVTPEARAKERKFCAI